MDRDKIRTEQVAQLVLTDIQQKQESKIRA